MTPTLQQIADFVALKHPDAPWLSPGSSKYLWASACPHMTAEHPRQPLTEAYTQLPVVPDLSLCLGDFHDSQSPVPVQDTVSRDIVVSDANGVPGLRTIAGNHDGGYASLQWYESCFPGDPTPHYEIIFGNVAILMLHDRNDLPYTWGRQGSPEVGGHGSGAITLATWVWLFAKVQEHRAAGRNVIICAHHLPRDTTYATGQNEGDNYHGASGIPEGRGALWSIFDEVNGTADDGTHVFRDLCVAEGVSFWLGGHSHGKPLETHAGRGRYHVDGPTMFVNVGHLTQNHVMQPLGREHSHVLEFVPGSKEVTLHFMVHRNPNQNVGFLTGTAGNFPKKHHLQVEFEP